jgi:hypothetical protein
MNDIYIIARHFLPGIHKYVVGTKLDIYLSIAIVNSNRFYIETLMESK